MTITLVDPLPTETALEVSVTVAAARAIVITDDETYTAAAETLRGVKALRRKITDFFTPLKRKQDEAKRALLDAEKEQLAPVTEAEEIIERSIQVYRTQQQARAEAERREREAEARRLEELRKLDEAIDAENAGDPELAAAIMNEPIVVPSVATIKPVAKVPGLSSRETWHAEVVDKGAFIRWVAQDVAERGHLLDVNMPRANDRARAMKDAMNTPGLRAVKDTGLAMRIR